MTTQVDVFESRIEYKEGDEPSKMASGLHARIGVRLSRHLDNYVDERKLGHVFDSSATYNFQDNQPKRQPDVSFVTYDKLPVLPDEELLLAPDLAIEIVSKNDDFYEVEKKVIQYQQAGVRLIWIVRPVIKAVEIYRLVNGLAPQIVDSKGDLDGEDVISGFKLAVSKLFE